MLDSEFFGAPQISREMKAGYLKRRREEVTQCRTALIEGGWDVLKRAGHRIKGNAETFGIESLAPLGAKLEVCADNHESTEAEQLLNQLEKAVDDALDSVSDEAGKVSSS